MGKDHVLYHLGEADEAIAQLRVEIQTNPEYDHSNYCVDMQHIYWHLNSAWNGRNFNNTTDELTDELYQSFIQFPVDLVLNGQRF